MASRTLRPRLHRRAMLWSAVVLIAAGCGGAATTPSLAPTATNAATTTPTTPPTSTPTTTVGATPGPTATPAPSPTRAADCAVAPAGLVGWWPGDGSADDLLGADPGTFDGGTYEQAVVGQGFDFSGGGHAVEIADADALDAVSALTIDGWAKPLSGGSDLGTTFILLKGDNNNRNTQSYGLMWKADRVYLRLGSAGDIDELGAPLPLSQFSHVAGTYDGTTMNLYVDGALAGTKGTALGPLQNTSLPLIIGSSLSNGQETVYFDGVADEVQLFDRVLTADEIRAIADSGSAGTCRP
jgi:hypothetical protein